MTRHRAARPLVLSTLGLSLVLAPGLVHAATATRTTTPFSQTIQAVPPVGDLNASQFDSRVGFAALAPTAAQRAAVRALGADQVAWNSTLGTPRALGRSGGALSAPSAAPHLDIARDWLRAHRAAFGLTSAQVDGLSVVRDHRLPGIGAWVVGFRQTFGPDALEAGIGGGLTVVVDRQGRVVRYAGDTTRAADLVGGYDLSAAQAVTRVVAALAPAAAFSAVPTGETQAGYQVFEAGPFADVVRVRRIAVATPAGGRAAYAVLLVKSLDEAWLRVLDAATGAPLLQKSLVAHAEGTVYENYPGAPKGGKPVTVDFGPTEQSPMGWLDPTGATGVDGFTTAGNNADSIVQWSAPLAPSDQVNRPVAPTGSFDFEFTDSWRTSQGDLSTLPTDKDAAATNLFYHHNRIHDEYYEFGFTETGGNFQANNFGLGGSEGDPVLGQAQSGAVSGGDPTYLGRDNANFLTLPDGIPGLTSMYLWEPIDDAFEGPYRDGDFDATIIQHEYSHGLSNRYVGGGGLDSLGTVQSGSMGEGWGDWFAMNDLYRRGLSRTAVTAPYVGDKHRGIRNWNYDEHPTTYGDFGYDMSGPEVHSDGEMWTATLWDLRRAILRSVGGDQVKASDIAEHLVMDAMPLSPAGPSMLDMRDAILKAAELRYGARMVDLAWDVFAARGMGVSAKTDGETDTDPRPGFDVPGAGNGTLDLHLVNASTGDPIAGARVMGGQFEARATALDTTDKDGDAAARMAAGRYELTVQAAGFGIQRVTVNVPRGATNHETVRLRPNLVSASAGAKVVEATSEDAGLPGEFATDDTESSAWRTAPSDTAYNDGPDAALTVRFAKPSVVSTVAVSAMKPPTTTRFSAARDIEVQVSQDGTEFRTVKAVRFSFIQPRPAVSDLMLRTLELARPVKAEFLRVVIKTANGDSDATGAALLSEVQAFGPTRGIDVKTPKPDKPVTSSGSVAVGNISQGVLLLDGTEPYKDGVTTASWKASCPDLPPANGADAFIAALPSGAADGRHVVTLTGEVPIGEFLLYFYDSTCTPITGDFGYYDSPVVVPPSAAYAGYLLLYGGGATVDITTTEVR